MRGCQKRQRGKHAHSPSIRRGGIGVPSLVGMCVTCVYIPPKFAEVGPVACQGDLIERVLL